MSNKPGHITIRAKGGRWTPAKDKKGNKIYGQFGEELGVVYVSGRRTLMGKARYHYEQEKIERHNKNLGKMTTGKLEAKDVIEARNKLEANAIVEDIIYGESYLRHQNYISKIGDMAEVLQEVLKDRTNPMFNETLKKVDKILTKINKMSDNQLSEFYYENKELFKDYSDYYGWLKEHGGRFSPDLEPGRRGNKKKNATAYVNKMNKSLDKIIEKLEKVKIEDKKK